MTIVHSSADIQFVDIDNGWEDFSLLERRPIIQGKSGTTFIGPRGFHHHDLLDTISGGGAFDWSQ